MKKDVLTIVFAAYNCGTRLKGMLESLTKQMVEFPQTELIVIDDGGDEDLSWVREYPNTTLKRRRNGGAAAARNTGIEMADGEYLCIFDSDDQLYDNCLPVIYENMRAGYDWVSYDWECDGHKEWAKQTDDPLMINCAAWAYSFRREVVGDKRFPEHMVLAEDQAFLRSVLRDDLKHKHDHRIFYNYLWSDNPNSVVHRYLRGELGKERPEKKYTFMRKNVFCIANINSIGGIETMFLNMARKYGKDYDITIVYKTGDADKIAQLKQYVRVLRWYSGMTIRCEKCFCNLDTSILASIDAKEYYQIIHADYKVYKIRHIPHPDVGHYLGVSENTCKVFHELTGLDIELCYNPIIVDKPKKVLHLITASRLTWEKGKNRMEILAKALDEAGVRYVWDVYTDDIGAIKNPNISYHAPRTDGITDYIADADYLVQLSDTEGWSYAIYEALCLGTPVIVTDFPSAHEMGIKTGENGFILPMDMSEIPVDAIYKGLKKFKYAPKEDRWGDILAPGHPDYEAEMEKMVMVRVTHLYQDLRLDRLMHVGDEFETDLARAEHLAECGFAEIIHELDAI